jgi:hypothetical protein
MAGARIGRHRPLEPLPGLPKVGRFQLDGVEHTEVEGGVGVAGVGDLCSPILGLVEVGG